MIELLSTIWSFLTTPNYECQMAIPPLALAAIMAGINFGKSELVDKPQAEKRRQTEAQITRWSPWTGMKGQTVYDPSSVDALIQGGFQGYNLGQNVQDQEEQRALRSALKRSLWNSVGFKPYAPGTPEYINQMQAIEGTGT